MSEICIEIDRKVSFRLKISNRNQDFLLWKERNRLAFRGGVRYPEIKKFFCLYFMGMGENV